jgi:hypothetical protein
MMTTQFIANAVEDMGIKRKQKEKDMLDDIFASTVMINKAKEMIGAYRMMFLYCDLVCNMCTDTTACNML